MKRNIFASGFTKDNPFRGQSVGPLNWSLTRAQLEEGGLALLKTLPTPKGWTGSYPYVVKVNSEGEYLVYADGTAQWLDYRTGHVGDPVKL